MLGAIHTLQRGVIDEEKLIHAMIRKMKVLFITARSDFGGGPRHIEQLIKNMPKEVEIYMAYPKDGDPYGKMWAKNSRIKGYCEIPYRKFSLSALWHLRMFIKKNNITKVHSHGQGAGIYSKLLKLLSPSVCVIHTFHGAASINGSPLKNTIYRIFNRGLNKTVTRYICVSEGEKRSAITLGYCSANNTNVIYNGVEESDKATKEIAKDTTIRIVSLSRFDYAKHMDLAYEIAFSFKNDTNIQFIWVGDGEDMSRLKRKSEQEGCNIVFIGFSNAPAKYLQTSDIYLSTSRFEGLPYALIEACEASLPIVATDVIGNNEVCIDNENGILFSTKEDGIAAIQTLMNDELLRLKYAKQSRRRFEEYFTITQMVQTTLNVYRELNDKKE